MKITKIQKQKKNTSRYSIYVNDEFALGVDEEVLIDLHLHKGKKVDQSFLNKIYEREIASKIYLRGVSYLSYGMRSTQEMIDYLNRYINETWDEEERLKLDFSKWVDQAINKLTDEGYLNDLVFAKSYVRTHFNLSNRGPVRLARELRSKGVCEDDINEALAEINPEEELSLANEVSKKYLKTQINKTAPRLLEQKTRKHLISRGFSSDIINQVFSELDFDQDSEKTESLLDREGQRQLKRLSRRYSGYDLKNRLSQALYRKGFDFDMINDWIYINLVEGDGE